MNWFWSVTLLATLSWSLRLLAQTSTSSDADQKNSAVDKVDLNKVDFEQIEADWENSPRYPSVDVTRSPKLKDILEPSSEYSYASFGRPDPFKRPDISMDMIAPPQSKVPSGQTFAIKSKLQMYTLQELTVKGYWQQDDGERKAVVVMPTGEGMIVREGDPIATGKVIKIEPQKLSVRLYRLRSDGVREHDDRYLPIGFVKQELKGTLKFEPGKEPVFVRPPDDPAAIVRPAGSDMSSPAQRVVAPNVNSSQPLPTEVQQIIPQVKSVIDSQKNVSPEAVQQVIQQMQQTK